MISIVPYNPEWPRQFDKERLKISELLKGQALEIHHIGSTAVQGLCAKPKLDIIVAVRDLDEAIEPLESGGYIFGGELNIPFRYYFKKRGIEPEVNLHVYASDNPEISLNLAFRDFLRAHPDMRDRYASLKQELISQEKMHSKNSSRFTGYNLGKDPLIKEILDAAGFQGLCMRICTHHDEIKTIESLKGYSIDKDAYLVFFRGTKILGYAEIETNASGPAVLKSFYTDEEESYFKKRCAHWISCFNTRREKKLKKQLEDKGVKPKVAGSMAKLELYLEKLGKMPVGPKRVRLFHKDGSQTNFTLK